MNFMANNNHKNVVNFFLLNNVQLIKVRKFKYLGNIINDTLIYYDDISSKIL